MKIIFTMLTLLFTTISFAQEITLINNGKPGGTFFTRTEMYAEELQKLGYKVTIVDRKQALQGARFFNEYNGPAMMVWMDLFSPKEVLTASEENFVTLEYTASMYLCSISGKESGTVASGKAYVDSAVQAMGDFTIIKYKNSSAILNAALAKEVDFAYINASKGKKIMAAGYPCKTVPEVQQTAYVVAKNIDLDQLRQDVETILQADRFTEWHARGGYSKEAKKSLKSDELQFVQDSELLWKSASQD